MKIAKNTVVTLSMSVTDAQNNFIEQTSGDGFTYLHGGYDDFFPTIEEALGRQPDRPAKFNGIEDLPKRVVVMAADTDKVKAFIAENCK